MKRLLPPVILFAVLSLFLSSCSPPQTASSSVPSMSDPAPYYAFFSVPSDLSFLEFPEDYALPVLISAHSEVLDLRETEITPYQGNSVFHVPASIPYVALGEPVQIRIRGEQPDFIRLEDYALKLENLDRWETPMILPLEFHDGKAAFALRDHPAATLDSEGGYEPGTSIRGLKLICKWGNTEKHYTCMVRTDYFVDLSKVSETKSRR